MDDLKLSLEKYGVWILAKQLGRNDPREFPPNDENIKKSREFIRDKSINPDYIPDSCKKLKTIFSFVQPHNLDICYESYFPLKQLSIRLDSDQDNDTDYLFNEFNKEFMSLPKKDGRFETFYNLFKKYTWYIPGTLEMEGISLFEQFKAVTAISHCLVKGGEKSLLVGGDIPGIQSMLYTITSKGAAKSLRGRSFYLQMLCDIIVQTIIRELSLTSANIIYSAGGNFKILASSADSEKLQTARDEINNRLLDAHRGELFLAMDWIEINLNELVSSDAFSEKVKQLVKKIGTQKRAWFAHHTKDGRYDDIFGVQGEGGSSEHINYCEVCHVEVDENTREIDEDGTIKCKQCDSFEELSSKLRKKFFITESISESISNTEVVKYRGKPFGKPSWDDILKSLGYKCSFSDELPEQNSQKRLSISKINDFNFLPSEVSDDWEYGCKLIGNTAPIMDEKSVKAMLEEYKQKHYKEEIRNTSVMADLDATGVNKYGVLRMDVDWLGNVFSERLTEKDMLHTSALSASLSLFFTGWLNCICESIDRKWSEKVANLIDSDEELSKSKLPYIIYSGGDDLFIVGCWDVLPILAEQIRNDFVSYVSLGYVSNEIIKIKPCMTISAGISIFDDKFPIYQAAELAKDALDNGAKEIDNKDAIDFLGIPVSWEDFKSIKAMAFELSEMLKTEKYGNKVNRSFLTLLKHIADAYSEDAKKSNQGSFVYGKWMWRLAYSLCRMKEKIKSPKLKEKIIKIGGSDQDLGTVNGAAIWKMIKYLNLPVRWAEYLTRGGK